MKTQWHRGDDIVSGVQLQLVRVAIASSPRDADIEGRGQAEGAEAKAEDAEVSSVLLKTSRLFIELTGYSMTGFPLMEVTAVVSIKALRRVVTNNWNE